MLTDGTQITLLDHELAFSFTQAIFKPANPWLIPDSDLYWIRNHYFFNHLRGKKIDFRRLSVNFQQIDNAFWECANHHIPLEWRTSQGPAIMNHINEMIAHVEEFAAQLNRITST